MKRKITDKIVCLCEMKRKRKNVILEFERKNFKF